MSGYFYLATPYSKDPRGLEAAYIDACKQGAILLRAGVHALSPIAHSHGIAVHGGIDPLDHRIWLPMDKPLMDAAEGLIVCMMDGWEKSEGVAYEIDVFEKARKPIVYMLPGAVPEVFVPAAQRMV